MAADGTVLAANIPEWGTAGETMVQALSYAFRPQNPTTTTYNTAFDTAYMFAVTGGTGAFFAPLSLPTGASITRVGIDWYDISTAEDISYGLFCFHANRSLEYLVLYDYPTSAGYMSYTSTLANPHTVDPTAYYALGIQTNLNGQGIQFKGMRVYYKLQVSPAPASATFTDVPTGYWAFQHVEALAASGITAGCGGGNFCPETTVTRAQMAVFLSKALGLHWPN